MKILNLYAGISGTSDDRHDEEALNKNLLYATILIPKHLLLHIYLYTKVIL